MEEEMRRLKAVYCDNIAWEGWGGAEAGAAKSIETPVQHPRQHRLSGKRRVVGETDTYT